MTQLRFWHIPVALLAVAWAYVQLLVVAIMGGLIAGLLFAPSPKPVQVEVVRYSAARPSAAVASARPRAPSASTAP